MRFNELLAGVRGDVAVKVFGDEFEPMLRAANQIAGILRGHRWRRRRQGRAGRRSAGPGDQGRQGRDLLGAASASPPCRTSSAPPSAGARPAWCSRATAASRSWCDCRSDTHRHRGSEKPPRSFAGRPSGLRWSVCRCASVARFRVYRRARTRSAERTASGASS